MSIIKTGKGLIEGISMGDYSVFKGIPYAKPPVGDLRFRPPVEADFFEGVYQANEFKNASVQPLSVGGFYDKEFQDEERYKTPLSEDCLYLNIWAPSKTGEGKLPVAFWIHGGGFGFGYGHEKEFDGKAYCQRGVILVTVNYRLGFLGFLAHPWLMEESENHVAGNYGILDQIAALTWVYNNIEAFGGDPDNITVFGQSAGAISTQILVSSPLTHHMIAKAIIQSGFSFNKIVNSLSMQEASRIGEKVVQQCNITSLEELRKLPWKKILEIFSGANRIPFTAVVDNYVLTDAYDRLVDKGEIKDIPYMTGSCSDEIRAGTIGIPMDDDAMYQSSVLWSLHLEQSGRNPAYVYKFARALPGDDKGAFHSSELWYMFGTLHRSWRPMTEADYQLSHRMMDLWTNFMKAGNPNCSEAGEWRPYSKNDPYVHILDVR